MTAWADAVNVEKIVLRGRKHEVYEIHNPLTSLDVQGRDSWHFSTGSKRPEHVGHLKTVTTLHMASRSIFLCDDPVGLS